jgi:hypothetical protein
MQRATVLEHVVARQVALAVVELLEVVDVEHHQHSGRS